MNPGMNNLPPPNFSSCPSVQISAPRPRGFFFPMQGSLPHFAQNSPYSPATNYQFPNHSSGQRNGYRQHTVNRNSNWNKNSVGAFYCDTCDRGCKTSEQLAEHKAQHIVCHVDGCSFEAHSKIVANHIKMQHATGLAKKINSLDTPEDIKKWREQRRKNYPSRQTDGVNAKQPVNNEVVPKNIPFKRGRGGSSKHPKMWPPTQMPREWPFPRGQHKRMRRKQIEESKRPRYHEHESTISNDIPQQLKEGDPLSYLLNEESDSDAAPDEVPTAKKTTNSVDENVTGGLALLMNSYTSDQDEDESPLATVTTKAETRAKVLPRQQHHRHHSNRVRQFPVNRRQLSLLEKLLAPEIKRERNIILQCISYTVDNNFFDS